jgi:hypothetical protein
VRLKLRLITSALLLNLSLGQATWAQFEEGSTSTTTPATENVETEFKDLELMDSADAQILKTQDINNSVEAGDLNLSDIEEKDDIESLKSDVGDLILPPAEENKQTTTEQTPATTSPDGKKLVNDEKSVEAMKATIQPEIFDVGNEEKQLLELSKFIENKIPEKEWNEIAAASKTEKYVVQQGDWLWKIAKTLFGSGFYYSKIWSLNPHITNPHQIEPGMALVFESGDPESPPTVNLGSFEEEGLKGEEVVGKKGDQQLFDFSEFGDEVEPPWLKERRDLIKQGIYFQYASEETYDDLSNIGKKNLNKEYQKYEPPQADISIEEPGEQYDETGFDKSSKIEFDYKEGFFLNSFVTTNVVQDMGYVEALPKEAIFIQQFDRIYVKFDANAKVRPGDSFSVYAAEGKVEHKVSDRSGFRYTIVAQIKSIKKINDVWECEVFEISGLVQRKDRITVYTPKIGRITKTFSKRSIEAAIIGSYRETADSLNFGEVVYLDRGRADGVEMGNVFEVYSFYDRGTEKRITADPTYKIGELTVITLTEDFATALVSSSSVVIPMGAVSITKTAEAAARVSKVKNQALLQGVKQLEGKALDELDIELNLDQLSEDLLKKADSVQLTEDELEELERQERDKSVIKDHEKDLKELEKLEEEIVDAENKLNESKVDEDKFLEQQDLDGVEKTAGAEQDKDSFENLDDMEKEVGRQFMDEDLNARENPYGLTEFDLEEIDELLNTGSKSTNK